MTTLTASPERMLASPASVSLVPMTALGIGGRLAGAIDPSLVPATAVIGRVAVVIPLLGYVAQMLGTLAGLGLLLMLSVLTQAGAWALDLVEEEILEARRRRGPVGARLGDGWTEPGGAGMSQRGAALIVALATSIAVAAAAAGAPSTLALLTASGASGATFGTGALVAPTALGATGGGTVRLAWTPSTSSTATGYAVLRSTMSGSGYARVGTLTPGSATSATDVPGAGTWFYVLQTYLGGWTSGNSNQASATVTSISTGAIDCTSQAPETTRSGDNNGYQTNPGNACATDGRVASDPSTGTNTTNNCTDAGKDRHQFWGYAFGLPATVHAVNGITLAAVVGMNNTNGTTVLCEQVSRDGGVTWSTAKSVALSGAALATYTMGTTPDTWGPSWTPAQLGVSQLRVRLTDVATLANKTFHLDSIAAAVQYTP